MTNTEYPILFSGEMVNAILEGSKTQTRMVVNKSNSYIGEGGDWDKLAFYGKHNYKGVYFADALKDVETWIDHGFPNVAGINDYQYLHVPYAFENMGVICRVYPRFEPGMRLWVREAWQYLNENNVVYKADGDYVIKYEIGGKEGAAPVIWRPATHMPRWASRITLKITGIRVERVQDISEEDAKAEGAPSMLWHGEWAMRYDNQMPVTTYKAGYANLWDSINAKRGYGWDANPWVWVILFKVVKNDQQTVHSNLPTG